MKYRENASEYIEHAILSRRERDIKEALKVASSAGFQGTLEDDKFYVTEELKKLYEVQYQLDAENKEAAQTQKLEKTLSELFVRTEPVGYDRYFRSYWCFEGDDRLLVRYVRGVTDDIKLAVDNGSNIEKVRQDKKTKVPNIQSIKHEAEDTASETENEVLELQKKVALDALEENPLTSLANRPSNNQYMWACFSSEPEICELVEALDERGVRERALKSSIKARFDLKLDETSSSTPTEYLKEGSPYVGKKVKRSFGKGTDKFTMIGLITGWLPAVEDSGDPAIWHVLYVDGDTEDIEEKDVKKDLTEEIPREESEEMEVIEDDSSSVEKKVTRSISSNSLPKSASSDNLNTEKNIGKDCIYMPYIFDESGHAICNDNYEPKLIRNYLNSSRAGVAFRNHTIGYIGLRSEFLSLMNKLLDGLKSMGSQWPRSSTRRQWESSIKSAESADEFRPLLKEIEGVVRDTQTVEDTRQDEELANMRNKV